jgi:hypothetical protein
MGYITNNNDEYIGDTWVIEWECTLRWKIKDGKLGNPRSKWRFLSRKIIYKW